MANLFTRHNLSRESNDENSAENLSPRRTYYSVAVVVVVVVVVYRKWTLTVQGNLSFCSVNGPKSEKDKRTSWLRRLFISTRWRIYNS